MKPHQIAPSGAGDVEACLGAAERIGDGDRCSLLGAELQRGGMPTTKLSPGQAVEAQALLW